MVASEIETSEELIIGLLDAQKKVNDVVYERLNLQQQRIDTLTRYVLLLIAIVTLLLLAGVAVVVWQLS